MFDYLNNYTIEQATSAIYYAIRTLRHLKNIEVGALESEKLLKEKDLGLQIISLIIDKEGKLLTEFNSSIRDKYIFELSNYLDKRSKPYLKTSTKKEINILKKWRNESVHNYDIKTYNYNYSKKIFISYYQVDESVLELRKLLEVAKIDTIEWRNISYNLPILDFIESISIVSLAIFFINNIEPKTFNSNQLFELGYLFGKLGRDKIFLLTDSNSKIPSDLAGMYFINKNEDYWKYELIKRLDYSGISFDKQVLEFIK